jgi:hypothetical protein
MTGTSVVTVPGERDQPIPSTPARTGILQVLPSALGLVLTLGTLVSITWHAGQSLTNGDTYFHLRFGHEFLTGHWSLQNPGSVSSFGTNDWVPTQWLPQIVMAQSEEWFGLPGVAWLQGLLHVALAVTLWVLARRHAGPLGAALILILGLFAASPGLSMRPQVISYLLVAVTTAAWMSSRVDGRARWWLVPLTWVWAMSHGMWPVGIVIGLVAVVGISLDRGFPRRDLLKLAAVPVASAVAAALTPVGPALYPAVLLVGSRGQYFAEWQPADFTRPSSIALLILLGLLLGLMLRRRTASTWTEILLVGLAVAWAVYTTRTVGVAAMMLVPLTASALGALTHAGRPQRRETVTVLIGAVACLVALAVAVPRTVDDAPKDPSWSATLDDLPAGTKVLNDWGGGGYFMWRWPQLDLVMNGYGDIYTEDELDRNFRIDATNPGWVASVQSTDARYALLDPGSRLAYALEELEDWKVIQRSDDLVLLTAPPGWPSE